MDKTGNPRTKQDYLARVRSNGDTNNSVFFHEKNQAKPEKFYELLQSLDWLDTAIYRTRACFAAKLYDEIVSQLTSDSRKAVDLCNERIAPFRSDILVIDEVQDLSSPVLALALLLHRGEPEDIAIMGDDEQTLDLVEFDWIRSNASWEQIEIDQHGGSSKCNVFEAMAAFEFDTVN